jgi:hypothetical protein
MGFYCRDCGKDVDEKQSDQTMSDTPNTRAVIQAADGRWTYSIKNFCESMERKLTKLQRERDRLQYEREFFQSAFIEQGDVLSKVIEQRDRLAEALREIANEDYRGFRPQSANIAHKALSAMKGGSDDN